MGYDIEKEKREAIEAGQRALHSLRAAQDNLSRRILFQYGEAIQDAACQTVYGTGQI